MAFASISFVLNRLGELAVMEAALLSGVGDDIRLLRDKLEWLQTFIQDADQERREGANQYVVLWVRQTRDVAHEVEDVLDEFLRRLDLDTLQRGVPAWRRCLALAASCTTQVSVRHDLRERMDGIKNRLKEISDNVDKYKIRKLRSASSGASSSAAHNSTINTVAACNWNSILQSLPKNAKGSRIMIITRLDDKEAAYSNPKVHTLKIENLKEEDSKRLFKHKVFGAESQFCEKIFGNRMTESTQLMDKACEDMLEITHGLPLAIVVLAGLLRTKSISERDKVFKKLKLGYEPKKVRRILALSFDDLPSRLKSCFLYFAAMPENLIYNARRLVRLWVAEGFLRPKKGKTMEDIGQNYLKELISRGMIHLVKRDRNGGVWLVAIHDRLHAFAQEEAQEASFLEVHDNADLLAPGSVRRLHLLNYMKSYIPMGTSFPKMRSILGDFAEERMDTSSPSSLKNQGNNSDLRYHALHFLPASKFLRVIDLRGLRIRKLPSSVACLINLQTLDIKRTEVTKVTQDFWEIPTLRHVVANKLRLPKSAGVLNNMQTLTGLVCSDPTGNDSKPLHNMVYIRYMHMSCLGKKHWLALEDVLKKLESLMYLHLAGEDIPFKLFTNFTLRRLQILELVGKINTSNVYMEDQYMLPNVTRLVLKLSKVDQIFIDKIGELPSIMELVLSEDSYQGEKLLFSNNGFNNVTNLVMSNLTHDFEWTIRPGSIPKIERIVLSGCKNMKIKLEGNEGEQDLKGLMEDLKEVAVYNMTPAEFLIVEPANPAFKDKINRVAIKSRSEDITDAMQRDGRWRAGMIAENMYDH
ncbi:unnamed protein product [Alopecurus aequalis]